MPIFAVIKGANFDRRCRFEKDASFRSSEGAENANFTESCWNLAIFCSRCGKMYRLLLKVRKSVIILHYIAHSMTTFGCRCKFSAQVHNFHVVLSAKKQACRKVTKVPMWKKIIIAHYIHHMNLKNQALPDNPALLRHAEFSVVYVLLKLLEMEMNSWQWCF